MSCFNYLSKHIQASYKMIITCRESRQYILFGTNKSLDLLKKSKLWLSDGTFYTATKGFSQIYIIYSEVFTKIVPLIYILMKSKTQEAYKMIFMEIKDKIDCPPKMLIMDFEISVFNAVRDVF
ncbi:hypothetical protein EQH57_0325, partial [Dictyocoela roeselum]